jgi:hypothetical protein
MLTKVAFRPGLWLGDWDQALPFQRKISVRWTPQPDVQE